MPIMILMLGITLAHPGMSWGWFYATVVAVVLINAIGDMDA